MPDKNEIKENLLNMVTDDLLDMIYDISMEDGKFEDLVFLDIEEEFDIMHEGLTHLEVAERIAKGSFDAYDDYFNYDDNDKLVSYTEDQVLEFILKQVDELADYLTDVEHMKNILTDKIFKQVYDDILVDDDIDDSVLNEAED